MNFVSAFVTDLLSTIGWGVAALILRIAAIFVVVVSVVLGGMLAGKVALASLPPLAQTTGWTAGDEKPSVLRRLRSAFDRDARAERRAAREIAEARDNYVDRVQTNGALVAFVGMVVFGLFCLVGLTWTGKIAVIVGIAATVAGIVAADAGFRTGGEWWPTIVSSAVALPVGVLIFEAIAGVLDLFGAAGGRGSGGDREGPDLDFDPSLDP